MFRLATLSLIVSVVLSACTKCVECEIKLKQSQNVLGIIDEFCGTDDEVEEEESRLSAEYACIECIPSGFFEGSGVLCGNRTFTDSVETEWKAGEAPGINVNCIYYRDTVNVRCNLKQ